MELTINTTKANLEAAYNTKFEVTEFGKAYVLAGCVNGTPKVFFTNEVGALRKEDAYRLNKKQNENDDIVRYTS